MDISEDSDAGFEKEEADMDISEGTDDESDEGEADMDISDSDWRTRDHLGIPVCIAGVSWGFLLFSQCDSVAAIYLQNVYQLDTLNGSE